MEKKVQIVKKTKNCLFSPTVCLIKLSKHSSPNGSENPFAGASAKYLGKRKEELMKKRRRQTGKEQFTMHASLCGGSDLLKALGSEASYLADRLLNLSNDTE